MAEAYYTANMLESFVEATTIIMEKIGEAAEDMETAAEKITKEVTMDVAIMIMETIVTEMIMSIPDSS